MLAQVTLLQQTYFNPLRQTDNPWAIRRHITSTFVLEVKPTSSNVWEALAEEAFHITNAPEELLSKSQKQWERIHRKNHAPSLSVNDVVQVTHPHGTEFFLCRSSGWESVWTAPIDSWNGSEALALLFSNLVVVEEKLQPRSKPDGTCPTCGETHWSE